MIIVLMVFSCRSKKKITDRSSEKTEKIVKLEEMDNSTLTVDAEIKASEVKNINVMTKDKVATFTQADPDKKISFKDEKGNVYEVTGADFTLEENEKLTSIIESLEKQLKISQQKISDLKRSKEFKEKSATDSLKINKETKGPPIWLWIWLIIIILIAFLLWRLGLFDKRKTDEH